jgi:RNA polymerase sigma-70 factor (ECF subfamily)
VAPPAHTREDSSFGFGYAKREAIEKLDSVLAQLVLERRAAFVMYEIEGMSPEQISEALEIPVTVVYGRLETARQEFDSALARLQVEWTYQSQRFA